MNSGFTNPKRAFHYDYAVIGGDLRQVYLTKELARENPNICHYALCQPVGVSAEFSSLEEACSNSASVICPIPLSKDGIFLNQNRTKENSSIDKILSLLTPAQHFYAGCIPEAFHQKAMEREIPVFDFMLDHYLSL